MPDGRGERPPVSVGRPPVHIELPVHRTMTESWAVLPQEFRGITLQELWDFYNKNKQLLEEKSWHCNICFRLNERHQSPNGPCTSCGAREGEFRMRNLYEVNAEIIKPTCAAEQVSYAEYVSRRRDEPWVAVDTFVSHWWGEEFAIFMQAVDRYAHARCMMRRKVWHDAAIFVALSVMSTCLLSIAYVSLHSGHIYARFYFSMLIDHYTVEENILPPGHLEVLTVLNATFIIVGFIVARKRIGWGQDPMTFSFWICAFCNNQFAVDHAVGVGGDVTSSSFAAALRSDSCKEVVALLDARGVIYQRIWCAFELFFAQVVLPTQFEKKRPVLLINGHGIVSFGDAPGDAIKSMTRIIDAVRTADAQASVEADKFMIEEALRQQGTLHADLDKMLRRIAQEGSLALKRRRWAVFLLGFAPLLGMDLGHQVYWFVHVFLWKTASTSRVGMKLRFVSIDACLLGLLCLIARGCCSFWHPHEQGVRLSHRILLMAAANALPPAFSFAPGITSSQFLGLSPVWWTQDSTVVFFVLSTTLSFVFAIFSLLGGILYVCLREWMVSWRRRLEDLLL